MEILKGIVLLLLVLIGFTMFSLKMPKGMKAMGALAGATLVALALGSSPVYAILIGCAVSGLTIGYIGSFIFKNFKIKSVLEVRGTV